MARDEFLEMLAPSPGEKILDIGAGKGKVAQRVLLASKGADVYAVEPDERRVASMRMEFPSIKGSVAKAEALPFPDSYFDKAYATMALHHFGSIETSLRETTRVLKHEGRLVILEVQPGSGLGLLFRLVGKLMGEHLSMMTQDQCLQALKSTEGLRVVATSRLGSRYLVQLQRQ